MLTSIAACLMAVGFFIDTDVADELKVLKGDLKSKDSAVRITALTKMAALDEKPNRDVTQALAIGLRDQEHSVRLATTKLFDSNQDHQAAVKSLSQALGATQKALSKHMMRPQEGTEGAREYDQTREYVESLMVIMRRFPDDRCVKAVVDLLRKNPYGLTGTAQLTAAETLAHFGTQEATATIIKQHTLLQKFRAGPEAKVGGASEAMHGVLVKVAKRYGITPPEESSPSDWSQWLKKNKKRLPKRVERLKD